MKIYTVSLLHRATIKKAAYVCCSAVPEQLLLGSPRNWTVFEALKYEILKTIPHFLDVHTPNLNVFQFLHEQTSFRYFYRGANPTPTM